MVNLEWYRSFVAVYQSGTVTSASALLFLTQPAVSQHITSLETMLGTKLFDRMPRKMIPTDEGKALYSRVVASVNVLESTTNDYYQNKNKPTTLIRLGAPSEFFLKKVLTCLKEEDYRYHVTFGSAYELLDKLEKRKLDVVIATKKGTHNKRIKYQKLFLEAFVLVQSTQSNSTLKKLTDTNEFPSESLLLQQNWISYDADLPIIRRYWHAVFKTRPAITPALVIPNLSIIAKAVEMDKGISILPSYICTNAIEAGKLEIVNLPKSTRITNDIWIAYQIEDLKNESTVRLIKTWLASHAIDEK